MTDDLVAEQRAFYRAEAEQYDEWLGHLLDPHNHDPKAIHFRAVRDDVGARLRERAPLGHVLELAAGTGLLSDLLVPHATTLTLVDASDTSLALARKRLAHHGRDVAYLVDDVFTFDAGGRRFDTICFAAWLHHVPLDRFEAFWSRVGDLLVDGGRVLFDFPSFSHLAPSEEMPRRPPPVGYRAYQSVDGISVRDHAGRRWRVAHVLWEPDELAERLAGIGWRLEPMGPGWFEDLHWATATRP